MQSYEEVRDMFEEENVKFIRCSFFDVFGQQKNIAIMPSELKRALEQGISFDASMIAGFDTGIRSDLFLKPDLSTITAVPWRPIDGRVVRVFCDVVNPDMTPFQLDTRRILKKAAREAAKMGLKINFGPEMEFYVFKQDENGNPTQEPLDHAGYMDVEPLDKGDNIRREICFTLIDMGITPESSHHEHGPGQNEVDFRYGDALTTADNTSTFKWAVQSIAESSGSKADFSPKPFRDEPGNGMHINVSVGKEDGKDLMRPFMAGVLHYIKDMCIFLNPVRSSYERFGEMEAPGYISWSQQNRTSLVRIPASPVGKRFELRSPDPMANPYLAYALIIYAGMEGIRQEMDPGEPVDLNLYQADQEKTSSLQRLPERIEEAMQIARKSGFLKKYLPQRLIDVYCDEKRLGEER